MTTNYAGASLLFDDVYRAEYLAVIDLIRKIGPQRQAEIPPENSEIAEEIRQVWERR